MTKINAGAVHHHHQADNETYKVKEQKITVEPKRVEAFGGNPTQNISVKRSVDSGFLKSTLEKKLDAFQARYVSQYQHDKPIYISVKERHKKVSPFDKQLSSDRPKGSVDRYRAVNPELKKQGLTGKDAMHFPLKPGETRLYDGDGNKRGRITAGSVQLNFGQVKNIKGEKYYYAFSASTTNGKASGWIKASSIKDDNDPNYPAKYVKANRAAAVPEKSGKYSDYRKYEVLNVDPKDLGGAGKKSPYKYEYKGKYYSYKVKPGKDLLNSKGNETRVAATDYLRRNGGVINLGFNAAGVSNDTFKVNGDKPLVFHRAPGNVKGTTVDIDLFYGKEEKHAGKEPVKKMRFVYGYVNYESGKTDAGKPIVKKRWGWMALGALKLKS